MSAAVRRRFSFPASSAAGWILLLFCSAAPATTLFPIGDDELRERATIVVEGIVLRVSPYQSARGLPETETAIRPVRVLLGRLSGDLVVRDRGGVLPDGRWLKVWGRPEYVPGRRVIVFAVPHPDGQFQTAEFTLGKFEVWKDPGGRLYAIRDLLTRDPAGVRYLESPGSARPAADYLREYAAFTRFLATGRGAPPSPAGHAVGLVPEVVDPPRPGVRSQWFEWSGSSRYRWSNGASAAWILSSTPSALSGGGYTEARSAIASWTNEPNSSIAYTDGGTGGSGTSFIDLASTEVCGTSGPFCGSGVAGCGGPSGTGSSHTWRGESYRTVTSGHAEIRQLTDPGCMSSNTFAAIVTHELGHTLGFGHSNEGASSHDACRGDENLAQMRSTAQSRGPSLGTDDSDAVRWVYGDGLKSCSGGPATSTPTATRTPTGTRTPSPPPPTTTATRTPTPTRTRTPTPSRTPTRTPPTGGATPTPGGLTPTRTASPGGPPVPTGTTTPTPTRTSPPTSTPPPTRTPFPPTPAPTPSSGQRAVIVPVAGHVTGAGGLLFLTDVQIENPNPVPVAATLFFTPAGGGSLRTFPLSLAPLETRNEADAVSGLFGITEVLGALRLESPAGAPLPLRMTSRTYDRVGDGTFGHAVSGSVHSGELFTSRFVTGLSRTEQFRSNLGAVNTSAKEQSFRVLLRAVDGRVLAETAPLSLPAGGQMQWGLASLFPQAAGRGLTAEFRPAAGSSTPLAYAAVVDNLSGDPTFYPSLRPVPVLYLPGVARTSGVGDAFFASEVSISNASDAPTNVTVTFLERDRDNTASPAVSFLLGPRQTRFFEDFLWTLFGRTETYGALKIQGGPGSALLAAERISTASATTPGSVGQQVDPLTPDGFFARASLLGLREDAAFRSNVGVFNPNGYPVTVSLALRRGSGAALGAMNLRVPPYGYVQRNLRALFSGAGLPGGEMLTLSLDAGGAKVFAFAAVIDNVSQDPTFSPGLP